MNEDLRAHIRLPFLLAFLLLAALMLFSVMPHRPRRAGGDAAPVTQTAEPAVAAHAYLVRFIGNPIPIIKRREWKRLAPASLTKLMSAVVAREQLAREERVAFSRDAKKAEQKISSVRPGKSLARDDAIRMALVTSYNDAALALAETAGKKNSGGGFTENITQFVGLMNEKAAALGLADTHFENPTGLDHDGHYATAEDLARLSEYALAAHPDLWEISRTVKTVVYSEQKTPHTIQTTDELLYEFPGLLGGKTGFTDRAQGTLILLYPAGKNSDFSQDTIAPSAQRASYGNDPMRLRPRGRTGGAAIIVILRSPDRFGDGRKIIRWLEQNYGN